MALVVLAFGTASLAAEAGFEKLGNGKDMSAFTLVEVKPETYQVENGVIRCSGKPNGYFATRESYKNYVLRFDWKYVRPADLQKDAEFGGNSGLLLHITDGHKVWPKCIEAQLMYRDAGNLLALGGAKINAKKNEALQAQATKQVGEWNRQEVTCQDGNIKVTLNGALVAHGSDGDLTSGPIGWQSEGAEIHFRNLAIKRLD
jgi:hypothetical protein